MDSSPGAGRLGTTIAPRVPPSPRGRPIVPAGVVDLLSGNPDPALLPDLGPAFASLPHEPVLYGAAGSDPELLALAAARLDRDGVPSDHLTVVGGALDGIQLALHGARPPRRSDRRRGPLLSRDHRPRVRARSDGPPDGDR